jgi:hypothetical protein
MKILRRFPPRNLLKEESLFPEYGGGGYMPKTRNEYCRSTRTGVRVFVAGVEWHEDSRIRGIAPERYCGICPKMPYTQSGATPL